MRKAKAHKPEQDVIARIDALVDEQLTHPEHFHQRGDRSGCPHCGGPWHGLPGTGGQTTIIEGHTGAESYPEIGNGGILGCPGAFAGADEVRAWRAQRRQAEQVQQYRRPLEPTCRGSADNPYVDQIIGVRITPGQPQARLIPAGAEGQFELELQVPEGPPPDDRLRVHPGAIIPGGRRPAWAPPEWPDPHTHTLDRNGRCVWANCPLNQLPGWRQRWVQGNPRDNLNAIVMAPNPLLPPAPAGEQLPAAADRSGAANPDGTYITDDWLAANGFQDVGTLEELVEEPLYDDVILAWQGIYRRAPDPMQRAARAIQVIAQAIAALHEEDPDALAEAMAQVNPPLITLYDADMNRIGGGRAYTLDDVHRLRSAMWEHRGDGHVEITANGPGA